MRKPLMNLFVPSAAIMIAILTKPMKLIFLPMAPGIIMFIAIAKIAIEDLNNATNLSTKSLKNGVGINAFMAFFSD